MKVKLGRKVYDTEKAMKVGRQTVGCFGDACGFEENLFLKGQKDFFLYAIGGSDSQYDGEKIIPLALSDAEEWLRRVTGAENAASVLAEVR